MKCGQSSYLWSDREFEVLSAPNDSVACCFSSSRNHLQYVFSHWGLWAFSFMHSILGCQTDGLTHFDSRMLCYAKDFMVNATATHHPSTTVLDNWYEVFLLRCCANVALDYGQMLPLWSHLSKGHCSEATLKPKDCYNVFLKQPFEQATLVQSFLNYSVMMLNPKFLQIHPSECECGCKLERT